MRQDVFRVVPVRMDEYGRKIKTATIKSAMLYEVIEKYEDGTEHWVAEFRSDTMAFVFVQLLNVARRVE